MRKTLSRNEKTTFLRHDYKAATSYKETQNAVMEADSMQLEVFLMLLVVCAPPKVCL